LKRGEEEDRQHLRVRIACLAGGMGILKIGAYTEHEREQLKERAQKAIAVLEMAVTAGVVPGGGIAYLDCIPTLDEARQNCTNLEEAAGIGIVMKALEAPFLQIVHNHGQLHPPVALIRVREHAGRGYGFNALTGTFSTVKDAGILDCLTIARASLEAGASLAAMTLTTDTIVYCGDRK
jgi:chaperonin GroEL